MANLTQNLSSLQKRPYLLFSLMPFVLLTLVNIHFNRLSQSSCNTKMVNNATSKLFSVRLVDSILESAQDRQQGNVAHAQTLPQSSTNKPFQEAVNEAMAAAELTQTARSSQEWFIVVSKWVKAAKLMEAVPPSDQHYQMAQNKIGEYHSNWEYARQNFKNAMSQDNNYSK